MNTASPYTAATIGRTFGQHGSHPNKGLQLLGHALNSGVSAAVNGGSFAAGAAAGAGSELAAKALTHTLYGKEAAADPGALGEQEKTLVSGLSAAFGAAAGGLAGGSALNAQIGAVAGKNAVENNYLLANPKAELLKTSGCKTKEECERLRRLYERGEMAAAKNIGAPVVDTFLATLFPAYDFGSSYAQADTSEEKMLAFIALVPGEKLSRTAANALEKTVDLLKNGKTSEAYRYFQVMADGLKHDNVPLAMAANSGNVRIPKGGMPSQAMASTGKGQNLDKFSPSLQQDIEKYGYKIKAIDSFADNYKDALEQAFIKTGVPKSDFVVTKWAKDKNGKSFPVEYRSNSGAEVNIDIGHNPNSKAPATPHIGWQTSGKRGEGGAKRGHIFVPDVPVNRSKNRIGECLNLLKKKLII